MPSNQTAPKKEMGASRGLIKTDFTSTQIQVSFDRIEPETGESENVAVENVGGVGGGFGRGKKGEGSRDEVGVASGWRREESKREETDTLDVSTTKRYISGTCE